MSVNDHPWAVILAGGMEIPALALARAFQRAGIPWAVIGLRRNSLLRELPGCLAFADLSGFKDTEALHEALIHNLTAWRARSPGRLACFATEDRGLRCLNEWRDDILPLADFARARALRMGGLDKAELFTALADEPASARTRVLSDPLKVDAVLDELGDDTVFKPALKPWDMDLSVLGNGAKIVTRREGESRRALCRRLEAAWPLSARWVAQPRLREYADGERGAWVAGAPGGYAGIGFVERLKHPRSGGTGCWVEAGGDPALVAPAQCILSAIEFVGLAEVPFLLDDEGTPRLLELNARAWLQVGLAERAGLPVGAIAYHALTGVAIPVTAHIAPASWVNVERALLAMWADPERGKRLSQLWSAWRRDAAELAMYSDVSWRIRARWLARIGSTVLPGRQ